MALSAIPRLGRANLGRVPAESRARTAAAGLRGGIVHLGLGAFHRAHQAVYTEDAVAAAGGDWGIVGVSPRSRDIPDRLAAQDRLFSVTTTGADGAWTRVVGVLTGVLHGPSDPAGVIARLAGAATRVWTITVTEKGYRLDPATGRLRTGDQELRAELAGERPAVTVPGLLVRGLVERALADTGPLTVLCCDNLPSNGKRLAGLVDQALALVPAATATRTRAWVERNVTFPSSMVDRIVPAPDGTIRARALAYLGVADLAAVAAEPFSQWVIEDAFAAGRPAWELAGATLAADVAPWETLKLRVLNGAHSTVAYLGALAGRSTVAEAMALHGMPDLLRCLWQEDVAPTLTVPKGVDFQAYADEVLRRFTNPAMPYQTLQVAMDGSQKLPQRLVGTVTDRLRAGAEPRWASFAVAAWIRFVQGTADTGTELPLDDPLAERIRAKVAGAGDRPAAAADALLGMTEIFGDEPAAHDGFRALVSEWLAALTTHGAAGTLASLRGGS
jgi:fructuronate reductase